MNSFWPLNSAGLTVYNTANPSPLRGTGGVNTDTANSQRFIGWDLVVVTPGYNQKPKIINLYVNTSSQKKKKKVEFFCRTQFINGSHIRQKPGHYAGSKTLLIDGANPRLKTELKKGKDLVVGLRIAGYLWLKWHNIYIIFNGFSQDKEQNHHLEGILSKQAASQKWRCTLSNVPFLFF